MSTIKSSSANLTLNADGANNDIKFQSNGTEKASIDQDGNLVLSGTLTSLGVDDNCTATKLTVSDSGININGDITFSSASQGICLGVTSNTDSNTLDDYEEGTWTPTFTDNSSATLSASLSGGAAGASYTKIGNFVLLNAYISSWSDIGDGTLNLMTLPFNSKSGPRYAGSMVTYGKPLAGFSENCFANSNSSSVAFWSMRDDAVSVTEIEIDAGSEIIFTIAYKAA